MKTETLTPSKRKIINLDESTLKALSIMAKLSKERPEGHVKLNEQEKAEFEKWLGV